MSRIDALMRLAPVITVLAIEYAARSVAALAG